MEQPEGRRRRAARAAALLVGVGLVASVLALEIPLAGHKPLWLDEADEAEILCDTSYASLFLEGPRGQMSPAPLYYALQKATLGGPPDRGLFVRQRRVSLAAAALALFSLHAAVVGGAGLLPALVAASSLISQPLVQRYAAESRAYMVWMAGLGLLLAAATQAASRPWSSLSHRRRAALVAACVLLALAAIPGGPQAVAALAVCLLVWRGDPDRGRGALRWLVPAAVACLAIDAWYARGAAWSGQVTYLDLRHSPHKAALLGPVVALLLPPGPLALPGHLLMLGGVLLPALLWRRRAEWTPAQRSACVLALLALAQAALAPLGTAELWRRGYFFLPRLFLYLTVCRALLIAVGTWGVLQLGRRLGARAGLAARTVAWALGLGALVLGLDLLRQESAETVARWTAGQGSSCAEWPATLVLHRDSATPRDPDLVPNLVVRLAGELDRCGGQPGQTRHLVAGRSLAGVSLREEVPPGTEPLRLCGQPVVMRAPPR